MSDFLFLRDLTRCPQCRAKRRAIHSGDCQNCGSFLIPCLDFVAEKIDSLIRMSDRPRAWWAYDKMHGWRHRDHFMTKDAKPNERTYTPPKLPDDYGRTTTPERVAARGAKL